MKLKEKLELINHFKEVIYDIPSPESELRAATEGSDLLAKLIDSDILDKMFSVNKSKFLSDFENDLYSKLANDEKLKYDNLLLFSFLNSKSFNFKSDEFNEDLNFIKLNNFLKENYPEHKIEFKQTNPECYYQMFVDNFETSNNISKKVVDECDFESLKLCLDNYFDFHSNCDILNNFLHCEYPDYKFDFIVYDHVRYELVVNDIKTNYYIYRSVVDNADKEELKKTINNYFLMKKRKDEFDDSICSELIKNLNQNETHL